MINNHHHHHNVESGQNHFGQAIKREIKFQRCLTLKQLEPVSKLKEKIPGFYF